MYANSNETRVLRLGWVADREDVTNTGTCIAIARPTSWMNVRGLFNAHHRQMAGTLRRESRPGVMVFVLGGAEIEGCLWLSATDDLRAATIGRHSCADLYLPMEAGLSLRHCLVLVRRVGDGVRVHVVDLSSTAGLRLEDGQEARAVEADGHFFLRVPGAVIACFPTGVPLPWDPDAMPAFGSLAAREGVPLLQVPRPIWRAQFVPEESSRMTVCPAPIAAGPVGLLEPRDVLAGFLTLASPIGHERLPVGLSALDRGVVVGRSNRCAGTRALSHDSVSRVHALLLRRDGHVFLADAGSTNGIWLGEEEIKCTRVVPHAEYHLGERASLAWAPAG